MQRLNGCSSTNNSRRSGDCGVLLAIVVFVFAAHLTNASGQDASSLQGKVTTLELGKPVDTQISGKTSHQYDVSLEASQTVGITVEQLGVDVVVSVTDADGKLLAEFDSEPRIPGEEHVVLSSEAAIHYQVTVKAKYSKAAAGQYRIEVAEVRPATGKDRLLFEAHELSTEARSLIRKGKFEDARPLASRALESADKALGDHDAYVGELLVTMAELERNQDNFARSEELFQRAIAIDEAALGEENPQTANAQQRLGALYNANGEFTKAEALFQQSMGIAERTLGSNHPTIVVYLMNLSQVHENRENYAQALPELERARTIAEQQLEPDDFSFIGVLNNLGDVYVHTKQFEQAEPLIERVIQMIEKTRGPDYPRLAEPLENLSIVAREKKQYSRAVDLLGRAQVLCEKAYGPQNSKTATVLIFVGNVYRAEGSYEKAVETYQRARNILEIAAGPYSALTQLTYVNAAMAYAALGDVDHAIEEQTQADALLERSIELNLSIGSEHEKSLFLRAASERTDRTLSGNALLAPNNPAAADLAALVLLQRKGRVLDAMSGSMATLRQRMSSEDQKLLDQLSGTTASLAKLALNGAGKTPPEKYRADLASLEQQRNDLEAEISRRSAEFRTETQAVTLSAVLAAIPAGAALLEFAAYHPFDPKADSNLRAFGEAHYIVYVLRRGGEVRSVELGPAKTIDDAVAALRAALRDPERNDVETLARVLDEKVMQPVRPLLGDARQLLVSPDGELNLIPFEALVDESGQFLVERYSISYLTTGRDLLRLQTTRSSRSGPVIVADPFFGEPAPVQVAKAKSATPLVSSRVAVRRSITAAADLSGVYFAPLDGTAMEARAIKSQFPDAQLLIGRKATESAVKQITAPSILHIATHGFFLEDANGPAKSEQAKLNQGNKDSRGVAADAGAGNPLLRSGLALAGANVNHSGPEKGILTALEASNLDLWGTKLVTLSACDTGVGEILNGEGVYGLRRAFLLAGAESVVMSLWPVSDYATREMMTSYYKGLRKGLGRGEALRQTELVMLKRKGRRHPFYWASFIESGEWANLDGLREGANQDIGGLRTPLPNQVSP
jgi:CHAT domain-containing protein/lipopolysaccharide biosynthesis regulator YciM